MDRRGQVERLMEGLEKRGIRSRLDSASLVTVQGEGGNHEELRVCHEGSLFTVLFGNYGHTHFDGQLDNTTDLWCRSHLFGLGQCQVTFHLKKIII